MAILVNVKSAIRNIREYTNKPKNPKPLRDYINKAKKVKLLISDIAKANEAKLLIRLATNDIDIIKQALKDKDND